MSKNGKLYAFEVNKEYARMEINGDICCDGACTIPTMDFMNYLCKHAPALRKLIIDFKEDYSVDTSFFAGLVAWIYLSDNREVVITGNHGQARDLAAVLGFDSIQHVLRFSERT